MTQKQNKFASSIHHHVPESLTRRAALKRLGVAGAGVFLSKSVFRGHAEDIVVAGSPVEIGVYTMSPSTVRILVQPIEKGRAVPPPVDGALANEDEGQVLFQSRELENFEEVQAGEVSVQFTAGPPTLHVKTRSGKTVQKLTLDSGTAGMSFLLGEGPLLGLGQGGPQFDRKGSVDRMRNGQRGYRLATHGGRAPVQWLIGTEEGWGMFIHHPLGTFDFTGTEGKITPFAEGLPLDVFIVSSSDPKVTLREYARITGFAELPARWTFGYMQSHRTLEGPAEVFGVAETMREKKLPCDALIYLGTEFCPSGWNTRNGEFTWHSSNFPDPKGMIDKLHEQNFRVVLHIVIEGRRLTGTVHEPCDPKNAVPSGRTEDDRWPADRSVPCYWPYHKPLFDVGVDGFWPDQGDGLDAPSRLNRHRMYWEGSPLYRPDERPFALHRNGYAGMQRYAAFLWSGDVQSRWETLRTHVPVAINTGLTGIPFWGTDIGGFIPTSEYTGELHVRWFQFGAFCPSFRAHGRHWHLRLPWGWDGGDGGPKETDSFFPAPEELKNPHVEPILKKYLELRYRLLPYTYTIAQECCETGLPMMRALWLHFPDDPTAVARGDQFFWGSDILVSPVVEKEAANRRLYLPRGLWYDFWTEAPLEGGREIDRKVDLATMPLHIRAGTILPLGPVKQYADEPVGAPTELIIYPGADGSSTIYDDDGISFAYREGKRMWIAMGWHDADRRLTLQMGRGSHLLPPSRRTFEVRVAGEKAKKTVVFDGKTLNIKV